MQRRGIVTGRGDFVADGGAGVREMWQQVEA